MKSLRGSRSLKTKSECSIGDQRSRLSKNLSFSLLSNPHSGVDEFTYLEHRSRSHFKGLYRPEKPKYRMTPIDSTVTLDLVSSTDEVRPEECEDWDFWRWFAWHNPQGLWADWKGRRRWWAFH